MNAEVATSEECLSTCLFLVYFELPEDDHEEANSSSFFFSLYSILQDSGH